MRKALEAFLRVAGKTLRWTLIFAVTVAVLGVVALGIAWEYPDLWLREPTLHRAARALRPSTEITWTDARVEVEKPSFFVRQIGLDFEDLRVLAGPVHAFAKAASLRLTFRIGWNGVTVAIESLDVDGRVLDIAVEKPSEEPPKKTAESSSVRLPAWLSYLDVKRAVVAFKEAHVATGEMSSHFGVTLETRPDGRGVRWDLAIQSRTKPKTAGEIAADARIRLTSLAGPWFGPYAAKVYVRAEDRDLGSGTLTAAGTPTLEGTSSFRGSLTAVLKSKVRIRSAFNVAIAPDRIDVTPSGRVTLPKGPLAGIELAECPVTLRLPVTDLPKSLHCRGAFRARDGSERWDGQKWRLDASRNRWELAFDDLVDLKSTTARLVVDLEDKPHVELMQRRAVAVLEAKVADYAALAHKLYPGEFSIPQPFASLAGDVLVRADWTGALNELASGDVAIPWTVSTKLASPRQRFRTASKGIFRLPGDERPGDLEATVLLEDVALDLPDMSLSPIRLMPDGRIRPFEAESEQNEAASFRYRIAVKTREGHPLTLRSNLAQGPVPIALNLLLSDDAGPRGFVTVQSFPVEFFRRRGELERLRISFAAKGGNPVIDAALRVKYAEYVITLKAIGPASKPSFEASSEPPLPQRDVWAALLFGRKLEADGKAETVSMPNAPQAGSPFASRLSTDDARSAAEMQAAAVDGGLSLATMYLLASTPVESVSYNPASGEFRAAVRLSDGAALTVGSDLKNRGSVGFRYRLGNNWYVTTTLEDAFDFNNPRLGTRLEWTRRY